MTFASRAALLFSCSLFALTTARCAGSGNGGSAGQTGSAGTTGTSGTTGAGQAGRGGGSGGTTSVGTGGQAGTSASGTAGTSAGGGQSGSVGQTGTGGATGSAGSAAGTTGTAGSGGTTAAGGSGGSAAGGTTGGFTPYKCPAGPFTNPTPSSLTPTRIAGVPTADQNINGGGYGFSNVEGPVWIGDALYVSEMGNSNNIPPARIFKIASDGTVTVAIPDSGSNGLAVDAHGNIVSANHKAGGIVSFSLPSGTPTTLVNTYMGTRFISPNDLAIHSNGTIYFSDPDYQGPQGAGSQTQTRLYRLPPGSTQVSVIDATLSEPNGVTLSLDESILYVTDHSGIHKYPVAGDGTVGTGSPFATSAVTNGDGMAIDCAGNLYVAVPNSTNVVVVSPSGTSLGNIVVNGVSAVTNAAFGGADHKTLFITAQGTGAAAPSGPGSSSQGVFKVAMPLPGMPY
jgi:gluconolactonase